MGDAPASPTIARDFPAVITDTSTGHEYKIEGKRILFHHMNDMLDALAIHDPDDAHPETAVAAE